MGNVSGVNSQDFLKGSRALVQIAPWITAGSEATSTLISLGFVDDVEFIAESEVKKITAANCYIPTDAYLASRNFGAKFTIKEGRLRHFAQALMDDPVATTGDVTVTPTPTFTAVEALDEQQAIRYWQLQITIADQSMLATYTEDAATTYTKRKIVFWRGLVECKASAKLVKDGEWAIPVVFHPVIDTSVTYSKGVTGRVGKITDSKT